MNIKIIDKNNGAVIYNGANLESAQHMADAYDVRVGGAWEAELYFDGIKSERIDGVGELFGLDSVSYDQAVEALHDACNAVDANGNILRCPRYNKTCFTDNAESECPWYHRCNLIANADDLACLLEQDDGLRKAREYHGLFIEDRTSLNDREMTEQEFLKDLRKECSAIDLDGSVIMCNIEDRPVTPLEDDYHDSVPCCEQCPHIKYCSQHSRADYLTLIHNNDHDDFIAEAAAAFNVELIEK